MSQPCRHESPQHGMWILLHVFFCFKGLWPKLALTPSATVGSRSCWWQQKLCPFSNPKDRTGVQVMVLLRIQADADLPLAQVQPGMELPECVLFPNSPSINAQNIWYAHWTVVRSNQSMPGISRFVSCVWIQLGIEFSRRGPNKALGPFFIKCIHSRSVFPSCFADWSFPMAETDFEATFVKFQKDIVRPSTATEWILAQLSSFRALTRPVP